MSRQDEVQTVLLLGVLPETLRGSAICAAEHGRMAHPQRNCWGKEWAEAEPLLFDATVKPIRGYAL